MQKLTTLLTSIESITQEAGKAILDIYDRDYQIKEKQDSSPLTEADLAAHKIICKGLEALTPDIPILSEESANIPFSKRQAWKRYWLVDPLDGTKEFINKNGEFTVNIALVQDHRPILGVVHVPVKNITYSASTETGATKTSEGQTTSIHCKPPTANGPVRVVGSRSHRGSSLDAFLDRLPAFELLSMGSSLKLCLVAEGMADIYPRLGPTSEWDTAAAQCVVEQAGGVVYNVETWKPLEYNRKESVLNPYFFVTGDTETAWQAYFTS